jgi:hypothetical protein
MFCWIFLGIGSSVSYFQQFRLALIKCGHTNLANYVNKPTDKEDEILNTALASSITCFSYRSITYVSWAEKPQRYDFLYQLTLRLLLYHKWNKMYIIVIHIRNYVQRGAKKYPTKHGVMFNV